MAKEYDCYIRHLRESIEDKEGEEIKVIVRDYEKCSGCRRCELACSMHHEEWWWPEASRIRVFMPFPGVEVPGSNRKIVKTKRFVLEPMLLDDAIERMEELEHSFFLFLDADAGEMKLLYRRNDGNFGLIEPMV